MTLFTDRGPALSGSKTATYRADEAKASQEFRKAYESKTNILTSSKLAFTPPPRSETKPPLLQLQMLH